MNEVLVYINKVCDNADGSHEYDFVFSECPEDVWALEWDVYNPSSCEYTFPEETTISNIYRAKTKLPLRLVQQTGCYSIEYATLGILALGWIDIENLPEYPEHGRMVFHFGDSKDKVSGLLGKYNYEFCGE